jgi:transcriptional regulator with XRE-family HTH domain
VLAALSVNKSQLASLLGVSRPTLYEWKRGKEPNAANSRRLSAIVHLLSLEGVHGSAPLNARFVRQPLEGQDESLLEALSEDVVDEVKITRMIREVRALGASADARRAAREERLRALGYDEPSSEQRKDQLTRSLATRDWPKP